MTDIALDPGKAAPPRSHGPNLDQKFDLRTAGLELTHGHQNPFEQIDRLEPGDNDRHVIALAKLRILRVSDDGAHVARREKRLNAAPRGVENRPQCGRHEHLRHEE